MPETPLREPVSSTSQKNLVVTQKAQVNPESTSETNPPSVGNQKLTSNDSTESISDTRSSTETNIKSLRDFKLPHFDGRLNNTGFIDRIMRKSKLSINKNTELARDILGMTLDLLDNRTNTEYWNILTSSTERLRTNYSFKYSCKRLDDFFCEVAEHVWPNIISEIQG